MPGWHEKTEPLRKSGKLQVLGLIQEQHPDRCRLFMQWHRMDWPVLVDPLNLLGVDRVPLTYLIDEHGIIRKARPRPGDLEAFVATTHPKLEGLADPTETPDLDARIRHFPAGRRETPGVSDWVDRGDALFLRGGPKDVEGAVAAYQRVRLMDPPPEATFRLGVALRRRFDSEHPWPGDFQAAIDAWQDALEQQPNQYIWRRRIQQYGPRPDQPYPFYTWVDAARREITERGETPVDLRVEPSGAELAGLEAEAAEGNEKEPEADPDGRITQDDTPLILADVAGAPATDAKRKVARVHVTLRPFWRTGGHWNNEAGDTAIWLSPPEGVRLDRKWAVVPRAPAETSDEARRAEFEVNLDGVEGDRKTVEIPGYALYYACKGEDGQCLYLRQDFVVTIRVR